jgi:hypothetical protein
MRKAVTLLSVALALAACSGQGDPIVMPTTQQTPAAPTAPSPTPAPEPQPPQPEITLAFAGTMGVGGDSRLTGSITYELFQGPSGTDVRGLKPNVVYTLTKWDVTIEAGPSLEPFGVPSNVYKNDLEGHTVEFCQGICVFGSGNTVTLIFANHTAYKLYVYFSTMDPTPLINPPGSAAEWGVPLESSYRIPCPVCSPLVFVTMSGGMNDGKS